MVSSIFSTRFGKAASSCLVSAVLAFGCAKGMSESVSSTRIDASPADVFHRGSGKNKAAAGIKESEPKGVEQIWDYSGYVTEFRKEIRKGWDGAWSLLNALDGTDLSARLAAARVLGEAKEPRAIPGIMGALSKLNGKKKCSMVYVGGTYEDQMRDRKEITLKELDAFLQSEPKIMDTENSELSKAPPQPVVIYESLLKHSLANIGEAAILPIFAKINELSASNMNSDYLIETLGMIGSKSYPALDVLSRDYRCSVKIVSEYWMVKSSLQILIGKVEGGRIREQIRAADILWQKEPERCANAMLRLMTGWNSPMRTLAAEVFEHNASATMHYIMTINPGSLHPDKRDLSETPLPPNYYPIRKVILSALQKKDDMFLSMLPELNPRWTIPYLLRMLEIKHYNFKHPLPNRSGQLSLFKDSSGGAVLYYLNALSYLEAKEAIPLIKKMAQDKDMWLSGLASLRLKDHFGITQ